MAPFLPELVRVLERQGELRLRPEVRRELLAVSAPTIDRLLQPFRRRSSRHLTGGLPAVSALRAQVPIRTFGEWRGVPPGALQADLALHCGESVAGFHLASLLTVDVATGWVECQPIWGLSFKRVGGAVHRVRTALPFPFRELHTDNGGEFLNNILVPWCRREGINFTRGRPWKKNDQAYAEQKIWSVVRRLIGYDRYSSRTAYEQLARIYALVGLYINFFQPTAKLVQKIRHGPRVTKRYDRAQTPYQRLLAARILTPSQQAALDERYLALNPRQLRDDLQDALTRLWKLADQPGK